MTKEKVAAALVKLAKIVIGNEPPSFLQKDLARKKRIAVTEVQIFIRKLERIKKFSANTRIVEAIEKNIREALLLLEQ